MHLANRLALLFSALNSLAHALKLPLQTRTRPSVAAGGSGSQQHLSRRAGNSSIVPLYNFENLEYIVNITLGGTSWGVSIDTGSSDLWLYGNVQGATDTGKVASVGYAVGTVNGSVLTAPLEFAGYSIPNQAFIHCSNISSFSVDITDEGYNGLVGLGPQSSSLVQSVLGEATGGPMMDRIFETNLTSQNYITFMMSREEDPANSVVGQLSVSEVVSEYEAITSQTQLAVKKASEIELVKLLVGSPAQHWTTFTDANGVIGPDGNPIQVASLVRNAPKNTLVTVFDSGFTLPQVSRSISDALYGRVQGAVYSTEYGFWTIPCAQELNITFIFGGQKIPIHPLDVSLSDIGGQTLGDTNGVPYCVGAFQPIGEGAIDRFGSYDLILGMGFLRNAYILMDYGDWVSDTAVDRGNPYIQLLALTDPNAAHADFVKARLNGVDTTGDPQYALLPASQEQHSPTTLRERELFFEAAHWPSIVGGVLGGLTLILGFTMWCCCFRKRKDGSRGLALVTKYRKHQNRKTMMALGDQAPTKMASHKKYASLDGDSTGLESHEMKMGAGDYDTSSYHNDQTYQAPEFPQQSYSTDRYSQHQHSEQDYSTQEYSSQQYYQPDQYAAPQSPFYSGPQQAHGY